MSDASTTEAPIPGVTEPDGQSLAVFESEEFGSVVAIYILMAIILGFILYAVTCRSGYRPIKARQPNVTLFSTSGTFCTLPASSCRSRYLFSRSWPSVDHR